MSNARSLSSLITKIVSSFINGSPVPTGSAIDWTSTSLPEGYIWADGSVLLAGTPHQALRNLYINDGFPHGQDGSGNPKLPDARGRVTAAPDAMGGVAAGRLSVGPLGAAGGVESVTLTSAQSGLPAHSHAASSAPAGAHSHTQDPGTVNSGDTGPNMRGTQAEWTSGGTTSTAPDHTHTITVNSNSAQNASQAHTNVQPTLVLNKIIKT